MRNPEVLAALKNCSGLFLPHLTQALDGSVTVSLGAKGVIELDKHPFFALAIALLLPLAPARSAWHRRARSRVRAVRRAVLVDGLLIDA